MGIRGKAAALIARIPLAQATALAVAKRGACILMLHRVLPPGELSYDPEMVVSTDAFDGLLQWLTRNFEVLPLSGMVARLESRDSVRGLCCLTFDDGWLDNHRHAWPLLRRHRAPATIFLASRLIGTSRRLWQERLWFCLQRLDPAQLGPLAESWRAKGGAWATLPEQPDFASLRRFLLSVPTREAESFADAAEQVSPPGTVPAARTFMDWSEVLEMQESGIEFGAHTQNHVLLTQAGAEVVQSEVEASRQELRARTNADIASFAYPWGAANGQARECVQRAGFRCAVGVQAGTVLPDCDRWMLPRVFVADSVARRPDGSFADREFALYLAARTRSAGRASDY